MPPPRGLSEIASYHAHIYFDATERPRAERLRALIAERFTARVGSWHEKPIGPHTKAMYQVAFAIEEVPRFVPWLMLNRDGLSVLVHPNTLWPKDDHLVHALWLGEAAWWWARPAGFLGRPRAALWTVRLVFLTMFVNGAIVFAEGPVVAAGLLATGLALLSWRREATRREPRHA